MVGVLSRKVWRELWTMRGQVLAIAAVILSGVATMVMFLSTLDSLTESREAYYRQNRFAEVFVSLKRAPESVVARAREIPGVEKVESRVVALVNLDIAGFEEPVIGQAVSLPEHGQALLNAPYLRRGRLVEPGHDDEVVISEAFAKAQGFVPGDTLKATINGRRKTLRIVGIAMSPEYIYQIAPGAFFPDYKRYGILWLGRKALASAYDMDGAFNDLSLTVTRGTRVEEVIERVDNLLEPYGGRGAYARKDQLSHNFLSEEMRQLATSATLFPLIFIGVAAFLLNVVLSRLIATQRDQIAILKAFGYSNLAVALHFLQFVVSIVLLGLVLGVSLGIYWGHGLADLYMEFYRFPFLNYVLHPWVVVKAAGITLFAAVSGTLFSVRRAAAMRPETPTVYRATVLERLGLQRWLSSPSRMLLRHIERRPFKSLLSVIGIALACGIMMVGSFQESAVSFMVDVQFQLSQRDDLSVSFTEPTGIQAQYELQRLPGVERVEAYRTVPVRFHHEQRSFRTLLRGIEPDGQLIRVLDTDLNPIHLPADGVVLTDYLGKLLGVGVGDRLHVEVLEGARPELEVTVVGLTQQYLGVFGFMQRRALNRLMGEGEALSGAYIAVQRQARDSVYQALKQRPRVAGTVLREVSIQSFYDTLADTVLFFSFIANLMGATIAFGVVYNTARIALSERGRELASLRVLGFTRGEIGYILLGELGLLTLAAIPLGFLVGYGLCGFLATQLESELYRVPLVVHLDTYAGAASVVLASAILSGWMIWRRLARLDMVAVLKTRE